MSAATTFMESPLSFFRMHWDHEPVGIPLNRRPPGTFSPTGGEGRDEGVRFMESFHGFATAYRVHERWRDYFGTTLTVPVFAS